MSEHTAIIRWSRDRQGFTDNRYSRSHYWEFDGGAMVPASASPAIVPPPQSDAERVDPEEAFVAALSSCHMLFFLSLAAKSGFIVEQYVDTAAGLVARDANGKMAVTKVRLRPQAVYSGARQPGREQVQDMHSQSQKLCFIANSVKTEVAITVIN